MPETPDETIIQSYVLEKWFVSTIKRDCSSPYAQGLRYYETLVWEWDAKTKERGKIVHQDEGFLAHTEICLALMRGEKPWEDKDA